jgi:hypothetical protein
MTVKSIIALAMCLLLQWMQISGVVEHAAQPSQAASAHCNCCEGIPSCPCATDEGPRRETPPIPIQSDILKVSAVKPSDTRIEPDDVPAPRLRRVISQAPQASPLAGYAGVRLSVAFCSFVI